MTPTLVGLLTAWLGFNCVFVAMRLYVTADGGTRAGTGFAGYPRLVGRGRKFAGRSR